MIPPDGVSEISWALQCHHKTLQVYNGNLSSNPLQHSGLSTSTEKITLIQIHYDYSDYADVQVEAMIYRAITEEGKSMLVKMKSGLRDGYYGIMPYSENDYKDHIQVVINPLTGKEFWFVKNISNTRVKSDDIFWFNHPLSTGNSITQDAFDVAEKEDQGIGFINSLHSGDHIVITTKSMQWHEIRVAVTLYTDAKEKCYLTN
ncbi:hypothetical protein BDQ17DRAFT_1437548 [Cyathus striatus]|nr:hypothetical protein BDQ17DRAFT_1437548 [Cyathus striatus]